MRGKWITTLRHNWKKIGTSAFVLAVISGLIVRFVGDVISPREPQRSESIAEIEKLIAEEARFALQAPAGAEKYGAMFTENAQIVDVRRSVLAKGAQQSRVVFGNFRDSKRYRIA
jgi:hypothetical protein